MRSGILAFAASLVFVGTGCLSILGGDVDFTGHSSTGGGSSTSTSTSTTANSTSSTTTSTASSTSTSSSTSTASSTSSSGMMALGGTCSAASDCTSGFCADNVCCDQKCDGTCQGCTAALTGGKDGHCADYTAGTTAPSGQCVAAGTCGDTGTCGASGMCEQAASSVQCSALSCANGTLSQPAFCNGSGTCSTAASGPCPGGFACADGTSCKTTCSKDSDCAGTGLYCQSGSCVGSNPQGTVCSGNDQCGSGFCVDGYCCNTSCAVECMGCSAALTGAANGTCAVVIDGTTDPRAICPTTSKTSCSTNGTCTSGTCAKWPSTTVCGAAACTSGTEQPAEYCSGSGTCVTQSPVSCGSYSCGTTACNTTCKTSADCASGLFCWLGACTQLTAISAGDYHTCAVTASGAAQCWGDGTSGQLGTGALNSSNIPVAVSGLGSGVTGISVSDSYSCAVTSAGAVYCWGSNTQGQLSSSVTAQYSAVPVQVTGLGAGAVGISTGEDFACALLATGGVSCWGSGSLGQLGNKSTASSGTPVTVSVPASVGMLFTGAAHGCVIEKGGGVYCWGDNASGQLGDGSTANTATPYDVLDGTFIGLGGGSEHTCVLTTPGNGGLECFGENSSGQLGNGTTTSSDVAVSVSGTWTAVAAGSVGYHSCALDSKNGAWCWGSNTSGQLGNGSLAQANAPSAVKGLSSGVVSISLGESHTCALLSTGLAQCWGSNGEGQLGNNSTMDSLTPVAVTEP